jgi:hypothetical protein
MPEQFRHTHFKDIVPRVPSEDLQFYHCATEVYEDENGNVTICSSTDGEDHACSDQFWLWELNPMYHMTYLGKCLGVTCGYCPKPSTDKLFL